MSTPKASRFTIVRQDAAGNPIVNAVITLYGAGATVSSGGPTSFTVDDTGSISAGATVLGVSTDGLTERSGLVSVASTTETNVTTSSSISGMVNNDRLVAGGLAFTIYKDEKLNESAGTTVTTDSFGRASGYITYQSFDYKSVGGASPLGTAATQYWFDVYPDGGNWKVYYDFPSGSAIVRRYDSAVALISGDRFVEYRSNNIIKWYVDLDGTLTARVPAHHVAGLLTVDSGGITVTAGTLTFPNNSILTAFINDLAVSTAKIAANAVHPAPSTTTGSSTTVALTTSEVVRMTTSYTPTTGNVGALITVTSHYDVATAGSGAAEARLYIGGSLKEKGTFAVAAAGVNGRGTISFSWFEPTMAASPTTIEVRDIKATYGGGTTAVINYDGSNTGPGHMTISEFK